jgi:hypothetical protein
VLSDAETMCSFSRMNVVQCHAPPDLRPLYPRGVHIVANCAYGSGGAVRRCLHLFALALFSAPDARVPFSCLAKKKEPKRRRPRRPAGSIKPIRSPALLTGPGGCGTRPRCARTQTVLAGALPFPGPAALLGGVEGERSKPIQPESMARAFQSVMFFPALHAAEQRRRWRKKGEDCLSPAGASSAAPARAE